MGTKRLVRACEILDYAIKNQISAKSASKLLGYGKNYVSDVKRSYELQNDDHIVNYEEQLFLKKYYEYEESKENKTAVNSWELPKSSDLTTVNKFLNESKPPKEKEIDDKILVTEDYNEKNIEWSGNNYSSDHIKTLEELLIATKTDTEFWNVKSHAINKWDTTFVDVDKQPRTIQNFQVKATLEKNIIHQNNVSATDEFVNMINNYTVPVLYVAPIDVTENNLLEINLADLHLGKLCWAGETGENYDVKIATERFITALNSLLYKATNFKFERILFPVGNDFFNVDNIGNSTTAGTPQDEDLRWQKTYNLGINLLVDAINLLKLSGVPVDVMIIQGNHDVTRSYFMGSYLAAWFREDEQVTVNNGASPRKYYKYGKVLLGFTHGSEEKEASLPMLMATDIDSKPVWSETIFHEWHLGHQHRKKGFKYTVNRDTIYNEELGVIVRYVSSLSGSDSWHHRNGYIGSHKAGEAFIWSAEEGMMAHLNVNINI